MFSVSIPFKLAYVHYIHTEIHLYTMNLTCILDRHITMNLVFYVYFYINILISIQSTFAYSCMLLHSKSLAQIKSSYANFNFNLFPS